MDEVQVDVVKPELGERAGKGRLDRLARAAGGLGGDEELGARDGAAVNGGAEVEFVAVGWEGG